MAAEAAIRAGAGLTTVMCPENAVPVLQTLVPNAMAVSADRKDIPAHDVLALGCGLSQADGVWENILRVYDPAVRSVWDADALNLIAADRKLMSLVNVRHILTPHPGEAKRLLPDLPSDDPCAAARQLAALGATVLYKGAACVCAAFTGFCAV